MAVLEATNYLALAPTSPIPRSKSGWRAANRRHGKMQRKTLSLLTKDPRLVGPRKTLEELPKRG